MAGRRVFYFMISGAFLVCEVGSVKDGCDSLVRPTQWCKRSVLYGPIPAKTLPRLPAAEAASQKLV